MMNAILIHGWCTKAEFFDANKPTASNDHWFPWITKQLMINGIKVDAPEMTQYEHTTYESWKTEFERFDTTSETILVGHSCGAGFLVRWLSENNLKVSKVILVAPWLGYKFVDEPFDYSFFDFTFDKDLAKNNQVKVMYSIDDFSVITDSVGLLKREIPTAEYIEFTNKGHFTRTSLGSEVFPELLEEIMR